MAEHPAVVPRRPLWAKLFSTVFHPLLMPLFLLVGLYAFAPGLGGYPGAFYYLLILLVVNTLAPAISLFLLYRRGVIADLEIRNPGQRMLPFALVGAYYVLTYGWVHYGDLASVIPLPYHRMLLGLAGSIFLGVLITRWFKISMHMLAVGGVLGAWAGAGVFEPLVRSWQGSVWMGLPKVGWAGVWTDGTLLLLVAGLLVSGTVGSARMALQVHRPSEVYIGWGTGMAWMAWNMYAAH